MGHEAIKLELIEWLTKLEDKEIIEYLKVVKDSNSNGKDWWDDLTVSQEQVKIPEYIEPLFRCKLNQMLKDGFAIRR
jgi:hypothetical protein